jgi:D-alanyl-D-alanine carboxypeptidase
VPSHRADTPADAPTTLKPRSSAHPPQQRRRDLRTHGRIAPPPSLPPGPAPTPTSAPAGLRWLDAAERSLTEPDDGGVPQTFGALALDPLFTPEVAGRRSAEADGPALASDPRAFWTSASTPRRARRRGGAAGAEADADLDAGLDADLDAGLDVGSVFQRQGLTSVPAPAVAPARRGLGLPHVGIAGALGLATIAVPLTGAFAVAPATNDVSGSVTATAVPSPLPPFPLSTMPDRTALDDVRLLPDEAPRASVPARLAAPRTLLVGRVSRSNERAVLPGCDGHIPDIAGVQNGQLPASMLCTLWDPARQLRSDAAVAIAKLNVAYQQRFGHELCFNDAYRSLDQQYRVKAERGSFAARPGTSEHGWGLAVDLCDGVDNGPSSANYQWMRENAASYGWNNPDWAQSGGRGPYEPWHWEYFPGEKDQSSGD